MIKLNGNPINVTMFSDKTSQVWKLPEEVLTQTNYARVTWEFENEGEFLQLAQLKYLLRSHNIKADLYMPYLPYARQDKLISNTTTFALAPFASLLNELEFNEVSCIDPHNYKAAHLINNLKIKDPTDLIKKNILATEATMLCFPDSSALIKYASHFETLPYSFGSKNRNQLTGVIENYYLITNLGVSIKDQKVLIVDDICDGGATFILLTEALLTAGAKEVNLYVSHGLFSKGTQVLKDAGIKRIFTKEGEVK